MRINEERLFGYLVKNAPDLMMVLEADFTVRYVSPSIEAVLGYRPEEVVGTDISRYLHPEEREWVRDGFVWKRAERGRLQSPVELRMKHADGSWRHFEAVGNDLLSDPDIEGTVAYFRDVTEHKALMDTLAHRAFHDSLTGLPNRALFVDRLEQALARALRHRGYVTVLFLDLDNFKAVNDAFGHEAGDRTLAAVGRRLQACVRPGDTVARFGGDEFAVLLEYTKDAVGASRVVERIVESSRAPIALNGRALFVTCSIGVATSDPGQDEPNELLRRADQAMYGAKKSGKARYQLSSPGVHAEAVERMKLEEALGRAVARGEFKLYYQPEVVLKTGEIVGMEALLRWDDPLRGVVSPASFVTLAETTGQIVPIGRWILHEACTQAAQWQEQYPEAPPLVSVNLSPIQFHQPTLVEEIAETLRRTGLNPGNLVLEITETFSMEDARHVTVAVQELKRLGVKLAIDDFGTGHASLSYLERFPVDVLKIDQSFVDRLGRDGENASALVSAMISFTQALGIEAVAEGVENVEQLDELDGMGCDMAQGFYFWEPLSDVAATELLRTTRGE